VAKHREGIYIHQEITHARRADCRVERRLRVQTVNQLSDRGRLDEDLKRQKKLMLSLEARRAASAPDRGSSPDRRLHAAPEQSSPQRSLCVVEFSAEAIPRFLSTHL